MSGQVASKSKKPSLSSDMLHAMYRDMLLIRRFEERAAQLYGMQLIGGFCHLYIGQEAIVVGMQQVMQPQDTVITAYRDHGHMLACGMDPKGVMAELTGRIGGYSKGKGGSMHMFSREKGFFGGHGIVGAQISLGTGLGFSHQYKGDGGVCVAYMGDGAANQGQVYESFNMASLWNLPVVYIIEDNRYGMGTSTKRASANNEFARRGEPYGIPGHVVDGMDVCAVYEAGKMAMEHARTKGPVLLHVETYRYRGHSMSDPGLYRSKEEVETVRMENDPIDTLRPHLEDKRVAAIEEEVKKLTQEAVQFAKDSPEPDASELWTDVYIPVGDSASHAH